MTIASEILERSGELPLPLGECVVARCLVDWRVTVELHSAREQFSLRIEAPFSVSVGGGERVVLQPGEDRVGMGTRGILRRCVVAAAAQENGRLDVTFSDAVTLQVDSHPTLQAWTLTGSGGLMIAATPGGGLLVRLPEGP